MCVEAASYSSHQSGFETDERQSKYKLRVFDPETGTIDYDDKMFLRITDGVSTIVASLLPVLSIIILYFIK